MNKCTDGKQLTYTDKACEKLGLKDAGTINPTVTIVPAFQIPAPAKREAPQNKSRESNVSPSAPDSEAYQCTTHNGAVSYSNTPCPKFSLLAEGVFAPVQQEVISKKQACDKVGAEGDANSAGSLSCP